MSRRQDGKGGSGEKSGKEKLVITPGGPRPPEMVHEVKPGQTVYPDQQGGYTVADELILTPGGYRSKSLVHFIEPGYGLRLDRGVLKKVELATQRLMDLPPALAGAVAPKGPPQQRAQGPALAAVPGGLPAMGSGWITYAWWDSGATPITSFSTTWTVPQVPSTHSGQTLFLFNGIQNTGANFGILQPVLQYGPSAAGGGNYWSIASWYVTSGGQAFHTTLVQVNVGQVLVGVMNQTAQTGAQYSYNSLFQGIANTTLPVQNIAPLHWANETLEAYSITQCSDYPAPPDTAFAGINIAVGTTHPALRWTPVNAVTDCGQHAVVVNNANPGGEIDLWYRPQTGWHHNDLSVAAGAPAAQGRPDGYMFTAQSTQHVNYRGSDSHIHELWWDNNGWHHNDLSQAAGAPGAVGTPTGYMFDAQGTQHVVYRGTDNHTRELWWNNSGWHLNDLTQAAAGAPSASGNPFGYMFIAQGTQHIVYRAGDNHIHELWWDNSGWHHNDLSAATGASAAAGNPAGYMFVAQGTQHVIYRGTDSHIHELWWDNHGWHPNDLTSAASAPNAAGDPAGYVFDAQGTQHVIYRGADAHVHELWWDNHGWHHNDLTNAAGAPIAVGDPAGYMFKAQGTQHVVYRAGDNHIHELWWDNSGWHHNDLSAAAGGAPSAASDPVGYLFDAQNTQHVLYCGSDNHIHELWWN